MKIFFNNVPIYTSGLSNDNTTNEPIKHKGPHTLPPKPSNRIPFHESPDEKSSKKRKGIDMIMDTNPIYKMSDVIATAIAKEYYNIFY